MSADNEAVTAIRIEVFREAPPAKGEAKSMLSALHSQSRRVQALLEAAATVMRGQELLANALRIDVTLTAPRTARLPDATNLLGGIGDVLQARATGADVAHLGELSTVACFHDDAQIEEIHYRRVDGLELGYVVSIQPVTNS